MPHSTKKGTSKKTLRWGREKDPTGRGNPYEIEPPVHRSSGEGEKDQLHREFAFQENRTASLVRKRTQRVNKKSYPVSYNLGRPGKQPKKRIYLEPKYGRAHSSTKNKTGGRA